MKTGPPNRQDEFPTGRTEPTESGLQDSQLVGQVLSGEPAAFDKLVAKYERQAMAVAYRLLSNAQDAQDVVQDALLRAYRALNTLENPRIFGAWLMRIVSNLALNCRRSRARRPAVSLDEAVGSSGQSGRRDSDAPGDPLGQLLASAQPPPDEALIADELGRRIRAAMDELPERQRLALTLFSVQGLPQKEVAEIIGCSIEAVKWHVFTARKKLKESLSDLLQD